MVMVMTTKKTMTMRMTVTESFLSILLLPMMMMIGKRNNKKNMRMKKYKITKGRKKRMS